MRSVKLLTFESLKFVTILTVIVSFNYVSVKLGEKLEINLEI